jgi:8-amino-7-oxononanoate synthase
VSATAWLESELAELRAAGLARELTPRAAADGRLNLASNDYLGLATHPAVVAGARGALEAYGAGAGASRLLAGSLDLHAALETRLAAHKGCPAALVLGSGYLAAVALMPALVGRGDLIVADRLAHASLLDGARLSRAELARFDHNDVDHLRALLARPARRRLVVTESVFSMDGDLAPLAEIAEVASEVEAMLLVDEAHAAGVFGPGGGGRVRQLGLGGAVTVNLSTLSKALGSYGGVLGVAEDLRQWLISRHRGLIYSTALPPAAAGAALAALELLAAEPERGSRLLALADGFRQGLRAGGLDTLNSAGPIVPVLVGDVDRTMALARRLRDAGLLVGAIRPPTVPAGAARLRLSVTLNHAPEALAAAAETILAAARAEGLGP